MRYEMIPKTDLQVSTVCMGTANLGSAVSKEEAFRQLDRFVEMGGNFLDTARVYANWIPDVERSVSEKTLGRWMKTRGGWGDVVVATKGAHHDLVTKQSTMERSNLIHQIEESCRNLNLDAIPLYYLHRDDLTRPVEYIMDTLFSQQERGLLRHLGCSNWTAKRVAEANAYAKQCGKEGFVAISDRWSLAKCVPGSGDNTLVDMDDQLYDLHTRENLAAMPFSSTAGGYLSKLAEGRPVRPSQTECYGVPENDTLAQRAKTLAAEKGLTVAQLAICWFYSHPFPVVPVTAFSNDAQMDETLAAAEVRLTQAEFDFLRGK